MGTFKRDKSFLNNADAFRSNALIKTLGLRKAFSAKESLAEQNDLKAKKQSRSTARQALVEMGLN